MNPEAGVIEIIVGPLVDHHALRDRAVPDVDIERKQRRERAIPVSEVMLAHLAVIVR